MTDHRDGDGRGDGDVKPSPPRTRPETTSPFFSLDGESESGSDYSRYVTVRGVAMQVMDEAFALQNDDVPFSEEIWEGIIEALENVRTVLGLLKGPGY